MYPSASDHESLSVLVKVILMQRGSNGGQKALYRLKFTSKDQDQGDDDSYTVAFEDQADANNFSFLLESFFKDLGDFSADPVPMSIQVRISTCTPNKHLYAKSCN